MVSRFDERAHPRRSDGRFTHKRFVEDASVEIDAPDDVGVSGVDSAVSRADLERLAVSRDPVDRLSVALSGQACVSDRVLGDGHPLVRAVGAYGWSVSEAERERVLEDAEVRRVMAVIRR